MFFTQLSEEAENYESLKVIVIVFFVLIASGCG